MKQETDPKEIILSSMTTFIESLARTSKSKKELPPLPDYKTVYQGKNATEQLKILEDFQTLYQFLSSHREDYDFFEEEDHMFQKHIELLENILLYMKDTEKLLEQEREATRIAEEKLKESQAQLLFRPMLHGKATNHMISMIGKPMTKNILNASASVAQGDMTLVLEKIDQLKGSLGVSTHKLLSTAITEFTRLNHTGSSSKRLDCSLIHIPLKEYALLCGHRIEVQETQKEEDAVKEKKRADNALKEARKKINKDLDVLFSATLSWNEKIHKRDVNFLDVRLIEAKGIRNGQIEIRFSQTFSEYLVKLPLTQYPLTLLKLDERSANAYSLGFKLTTHYNMDNNVVQGTNQLLKVKSILQILDLPTYEKVRSQRKSWDERIKEPFEESLGKLVSCGFLADWRYSHSKAIPLEDEEATFENYQEWEETLIFYTLQETVDHNPRRETLPEKTAKPKKKPKTTKKKEKESPEEG